MYSPFNARNRYALARNRRENACKRHEKRTNCEENRQINMACLCLYCTRVVYELHVLIIISGSPRLQWPIIDLFSVIWLMDTNDEKLLFENKLSMFINHNIRCGSHSAHTSGSFYLFVWILHGSNWIHICTWHIHSSHDSDHNNNGSHGASTPDRMQS